MAHTISYEGFKLVRLAGAPIGEPDFFAIRAGELGVPVGLISGDQVVAEQVGVICPWAERVIVKEALGNQSGNCIAPARAREMIRAGAERAVARARAGELRAFRAKAPPYELEVDLREPIGAAMRANLESLADFAIVDERCVRVRAPNMDLGFRRVAYLGYANRPGVTRH